MNDKQTTELKKKIAQVRVYDMTEPHIARVLLAGIDEVPDNVKNYPAACQRAFVLVHNAVMERYGDPNMAIKSGWRGLRNKLAILQDRARKAGVSLEKYIDHPHIYHKGVA